MDIGDGDEEEGYVRWSNKVEGDAKAVRRGKGLSGRGGRLEGW